MYTSGYVFIVCDVKDLKFMLHWECPPISAEAAMKIPNCSATATALCYNGRRHRNWAKNQLVKADAL